MIVVTGATGNIGSLVVLELAARRIPCRAFVRDREKAARLLGGAPDVEVVQGDFEDATSLRAAVGDGAAVLLSSANQPRQAAHEAAVVDAVADTAGGRVVKLSTIGASPGDAAPFLDWHGRAEEHLRASGLPAVVLRSSFYMSNLFAAAEGVAGGGQLVAPADGARISMVDTRDVAQIAVEALTDPGHDGRTYELTGPAALTYADVAAALSRVLGRRVEFVDVPPEAARAGLLASGAPEWMADGLVRLFARLREGLAAGVTDTVPSLLRRPAADLEGFLRDHAGVFTAAARESPGSNARVGG